MQQFYRGLNERDRRAYAAVEVAKLGYGGASHIYHLLGCDPKTVKRGQRDLSALTERSDNRIRQPGGGRKKSLTRKGLKTAFFDRPQEHAAGDPMRPEL